MIAAINGNLLYLHSDRAVIDVNGVGYEVFMSTDAISRMPEAGAKVFLHIHTNVREDAITLYGFQSAEEKELFLVLRTVSGIGPKVALAMLSGLRVEPLCNAIIAGDVKLLTTLQGIGKKTAERICVELKEKVTHLAGGSAEAGVQATFSGGAIGAGGSTVSDAVSALTNLGYGEGEARTALTRVKKEAGQEAFAAMSVEDLLRLALRTLA